jgi:hypothetical protein
MEPGSGTRTNTHLTLYLPHHTNTAIPVGANEVSAQCMKMMENEIVENERGMVGIFPYL